jgi:HEAT repeat protein
MTRTHGSLIAGLAAAVAVWVVISRPPDPPPSEGATLGANARPRAAADSPDPHPRKLLRPPANAPRSRLADLPPPVESPFLAGSLKNDGWIETRTAELDDLAWFEDAESLAKIQAELQNPLPEIRAAALAAIVAFGDRESIPILEAVAGRTRDPLEQKALGEAIDYLKLPTLIEQLEPEN